MSSKNNNNTSRSLCLARQTAKPSVKMTAKLWRFVDGILASCASIWHQPASRDARERDPGPPITLGIAEHHRLQVLALTALSHNSFASERLLHELDRARVVPDEALAEDIVRIGSTVTFSTRAGETYSKLLVHPDQLDDKPHAVSVLSPIGAALIGLGTGQAISWISYDGEQRGLTVLSVSHGVNLEQDSTTGGMQ